MRRILCNGQSPPKKDAATGTCAQPLLEWVESGVFYFVILEDGSGGSPNHRLAATYIFNL